MKRSLDSSYFLKYFPSLSLFFFFISSNHFLELHKSQSLMQQTTRMEVHTQCIVSYFPQYWMGSWENILRWYSLIIHVKKVVTAFFDSCPKFIKQCIKAMMMITLLFHLIFAHDFVYFVVAQLGDCIKVQALYFCTKRIFEL